MGYDGIILHNSINIGKIYSIHYFEYMNDFSFEGESHNFWEFICVDKGEVGVTAGNSFTILKRWDIAFHQPNEFHNVQAVSGIAPNLVVISFQCADDAMRFFKKKILQIDEAERNLLADIIIEARRCFDCRLDDPYLQNMPMKEPDLFGAEQMIHLLLTQFIIHLIRRYSTPLMLHNRLPRLESIKATKSRSDTDVFNRIVGYLEEKLNTRVTMGIIEYFSLMKINAAKELMRTNQMNFTQISEHLGYTSIHYFSRQFKKVTGMTPSEYASSIKAMADGSF